MISENIKIEIINNEGSYVWVTKCLNEKGEWYPSGDSGTTKDYKLAAEQAFKSAEMLSACEDVTTEKLQYAKGNKEPGYDQAVQNVAYTINNMTMDHLDEENPLVALVDIIEKQQENIIQVEQILNTISETYNVPLSTIEQDVAYYIQQQIMNHVI